MMFSAAHFWLILFSLLSFTYNNISTTANVLETKGKDATSDALVDKILDLVRPMIIEQGLDPAALPGGKIEFSETIFGITFHGSAEVLNNQI